MGEAILKFTLPDELEDFEDALHGGLFHLALIEIDDEIRKTIKYEDLTTGESQRLQGIRDMIRRICEDKQISLCP